MGTRRTKFITLPAGLKLVDAQGAKRQVAAGLRVEEDLARELGFDMVDDLVRVNPLLKMLTSQAPSAALQFPVSLSPAVTEEAISVLLRGIAGAMRPAASYTMGQVGAFGSAPLIPPIVPWWLLLPEGSLVHINTVSHEGCDCPCPEGITAEFTVEWNAPGPFNPDLFSDEMKGGTTENPQGQPGGVTEEISGSADVSIDFGNPNLGIVNTGDLIFSLKAKPFFSSGFDDDDCCIHVDGSFQGSASITSNGVSASTLLSESVKLGECSGEICCTSFYAGIFNKHFSLNAPIFGVNITSTVYGIVFVTVTVRKIS